MKKELQNIIFIDDDEITTFLNRIMLEEMKVAENIFCIEDEQEALNFIKERCSTKGMGKDNCPQLIFLDLNMTLFNGFEFLEQLASDGEIDMEQLYVVLLTASWYDTDMEKARNYPVKEFLVKPLTAEKVTEIVKRCLAHQQTRIPQ